MKGAMRRRDSRWWISTSGPRVSTRSPRCSQPPAATTSMPNSWLRTLRLCRATGWRASPASSTPFGNPRVMTASVPGPGSSNCSRSRATIQPWHLHERLWPALFSERARLSREV